MTAHFSAETSIALANAEHARHVVQALLDQGVQHAVISPGSRNTPLIFAFEAAVQQDLLRTHIVLDERVAGFLALGLARQSGQPVALSCTSGSAGAHYLPAIIEADHSQQCVIALTADRPEELQRRGAPQTTEQSQFFVPHVQETLRLSAPLASAQHLHAVRQTIERAVAGARSARRPLHINAAFREPLWHSDHRARIEAPYAPPAPRIHARTVQPSDDGLRALRRLRGRGAFFVGPIATDRSRAPQRAPWIDALLRAAERLDWPIMADAASPLRSKEFQALTHADLLLRDDSVLHPSTLDQIVVIGPWPTSKAVGLWLTRHPSIQVVSLPGTLDAIDPWYRVTQTIPGDLHRCLDAIGQDFPPAKGSARRDAAWACDRAIEQEIDAFCAAHDAFEGSIARAVMQRATPPLLVNLASSMPIRDVDAYGGHIHAGASLHASRGVNGIDGNIATTVGEALADPTPAVLLIGDLAFRHDIGGLMHAVNTDVTLTIVVIDNAGGGIFRHLAVADSGDAFDAYFLTPQKTSLADLARGCGARVHVVDGARALTEQLQHTVHTPGIDVLIVPTDGTQQVRWRKDANTRALHAAQQHPWIATTDDPDASAQEDAP